MTFLHFQTSRRIDINPTTLPLSTPPTRRVTHPSNYIVLGAVANKETHLAFPGTMPRTLETTAGLPTPFLHQSGTLLCSFSRSLPNFRLCAQISPDGTTLYAAGYARVPPVAMDTPQGDAACFEKPNPAAIWRYEMDPSQRCLLAELGLRMEAFQGMWCRRIQFGAVSRWPSSLVLFL